MNSFSCSIFPRCSGCSLQKNVCSPPVLEELSHFFLKLGVPLELVSEKITAWRSKAKLAVRGTKQDPSIGLFAKGTHEVIPMNSCPLHYPIMNEALALIYEEMTRFGIDPYEENGSGRLRYLQLFLEERTNRVQLSLVFNAKELFLFS